MGSDQSSAYNFDNMNKEILRLAIPNIISNISVPLLSTVDTALMGRLSAIHIGAVGIGSMIFNYIYWNFGFLRMGTTGLTAQAYGKHDDLETVEILGRAILIVVLLSSILLIFQEPIATLSFSLMGLNAEQESLLAEYFFIRIWAAPATLISYVCLGWFFGMQNAIFPMILVITVNVVNILLSFYLVTYLDLGIRGVAYGTVIAEYIGICVGLVLFLTKYRSVLKLWHQTAILKWDRLKGFLALNADIFLRTLLLTTAMAFFYSQSSNEGAILLAVNVILLQFQGWLSYGIDGFAFASESLVGKYVGQNDQTRTKQAIQYVFIWGMGLALFFSVFYALAGQQLVYIFTNQEEVILASQPYLIWIIILPLISTPSFIWDGVFIGLTASRSMRNSMLLAFVVYIVVYFLAIKNLGNHGLVLAFASFLLARGMIQWGYYRLSGLDLR